MQELYNSMGAILGFSCIVLIVQNFVSDNAAQKLIMLTLLSMLLLNSDNVVNFAKKVGGAK